MKTIDALAEVIVRVRPEAATAAPVGPDTSLADLGLDSLDTIRLVSQVEERFGIQLDEEALLAAETVGDFARLVEAATRIAPPARRGRRGRRRSAAGAALALAHPGPQRLVGHARPAVLRRVRRRSGGGGRPAGRAPGAATAGGSPWRTWWSRPWPPSWRPSRR